MSAYQSKLQHQQINQLFDAILSLNNREDCYRFFEDLCTIQEIKSMAQRLEIAVMLQKGETYQHIAEKTGVSTATISRVNRCLQYGAEGYTHVLKKLTQIK